MTATQGRPFIEGMGPDVEAMKQEIREFASKEGCSVDESTWNVQDLGIQFLRGVRERAYRVRGTCNE